MLRARLTSMIQRTKILGRDTLQLSKVLLRHSLSNWTAQLPMNTTANNNNSNAMPPRRLTVREILLDQAGSRTAAAAAATITNDDGSGFNNNNNQMAIKLLHWDKEIGLLRYYGIQEYMQQKLRNIRFFNVASSRAIENNDADANETITTTTLASKDTTTTTTSTTSPTKAKVAFMITTTMRQELTSMGYTAEDIKGLTPVEASLLLQYEILPSDKELKLPTLVLEYQQEQANIAAKIQQEQREQQEREQKEQQEREQREQQEQREQRELKLQQTSTPTNNMSEQQQQENVSGLLVADGSTPSNPATTNNDGMKETSSLDNKQPSFISNNKYKSTDDDNKTNKNKRQWFELVEISENVIHTHGDKDKDMTNISELTEEIIGLYTSVEEAELGLSTHKTFAERRRRDNKTSVGMSVTMPTYQIRESWR